MIKLKKEEEVILIKRRHYMVFLIDTIPFVLFFIFLIGAVFYLFFVGFPEILLGVMGDFIKEKNIAYLSVFFLSLVASILWSFTFIIISNHYLDYWIITDRRTIHTELRSFFSRFYSSVSHGKIQDTTVDVCGILPTVFNYGDIKIQTAGAFKNFTFRQIPNPYETKKEITEAILNYKKRIKGKYYDD